MKRTAIIFLILISFIGGTVWYGKKLPELSHKSATQTFNRKSEFLWQLIFDYKRYPEWRENVYAIKQMPRTSKYDAWKEINEDGITTPFQIIKFNQNTFINMEETGDKHTNSGTWHFEITENEDGTSTLTITEDRLISQLVPRVLNHFLNTSTDHIDAYFRSVNNKIIRDNIRSKKASQRLPKKANTPDNMKSMQK